MSEQTIIHIDIDALDKRLDHGKRWIHGWGDWEYPTGNTCLHGAIRYCQPVPGDAHLIEQVGNKFGFGIDDNDTAGTWDDVKAQIVPDITDTMLETVFGPNWAAIVALVRRAATLTPDELVRLDAATDAALDAAWDAEVGAAYDAARDDAARDACLAAKAAAKAGAWAWAAALDAAKAGAWAWAAAWGLAVRDLIGDHGFTQTHYNTLVRPWAAVIGPVHPDDETV